jgi:transposase-like protein
MDIAKMMNISERSVTRLLAKFRDVVVMEYEHDVVTEVDKMLAEKDILLSSDVCIQEQVDYLEDEIIEEEQTRPQSPQSQFNLCSSLLSMNVQVKDISKMLDISEKQVIKWKHQLENQDHEMNEFDDEDD